MSELNWSKITSGEFEVFTFSLVEALGFDEPERVAGSGDMGVDIVAYQPAMLPGIRLKSREWVFQCKRVLSLKKADITDELENFAARKIDTWMLVTTVDPSPGFRRWFETLGKSQRYPFHIQAWWKSDLERYTRMHAETLIRSLPTNITESLDLRFVLPESPGSYEVVLAKLRLLADSQIERFARGKYIPKLYVNRQLQEEISRFLLPDALIAANSRSSLIQAIEYAMEQLREYPDRYAKRTTEIKEELETFKRQRPLARVVEEIDKLIAELTQTIAVRLKVKHAGSLLIAEVLRKLEELLQKTRNLPTGSYFNNIKAFESLFQFFELIESFLAQKLKSREHLAESPSQLSEGEPPKVSSRPPEIQMLSDDGFIESFHEKLQEIMTSGQMFLRNTLVLVDRAGGGKTNLICHLVQTLASKQPVILLFGKEHFSNRDGLVAAISEILNKMFPDSSDHFATLDGLLKAEGQYLTVFVDGINENRQLADLDASIRTFLEWARNHRIRIILTCRDIYWEFFDFDSWSHNVSQVLREKLNQFSSMEYGFALPLYLDYYNLRCNLAHEAREACHHPLLLRFFCEAYGSIEGPLVTLGEVSDIRLKELFDVYLKRKVEQIRTYMGHRNADSVLRFLFDLVSFLFKKLTTVMSTIEIEEATGDPDTSSQNSLYLRLLDEDIIIEEQPSAELGTRRVSFVYEEFMEYVLALSIVKFPKRFGVSDVNGLFKKLNTSLEGWVNARGVGEYVALMLLGEVQGYNRNDAITFLRLMAGSGGTWNRGFWSVIGKCSDRNFGPDLFDEFYAAVDGLEDITIIDKTLISLSRYDSDSANKLAAIILWTFALPKRISWSELSRLSKMPKAEFEILSERLARELAERRFAELPGTKISSRLFRLVKPFLNPLVREKIDSAIRKFGSVRSVHGFLFVSWKYFPELSPFLINGLYSANDSVRSFCADRLRFAKSCPQQVTDLCRTLAKSESDPEISRLLSQSSSFLQKYTPPRARKRAKI